MYSGSSNDILAIADCELYLLVLQYLKYERLPESTGLTIIEVLSSEYDVAISLRYSFSIKKSLKLIFQSSNHCI